MSASSSPESNGDDDAFVAGRNTLSPSIRSRSNGCLCSGRNSSVVDAPVSASDLVTSSSTRIELWCAPIGFEGNEENDCSAALDSVAVVSGTSDKVEGGIVPSMALFLESIFRNLGKGGRNVPGSRGDAGLELLLD